MYTSELLGTLREGKQGSKLTFATSQNASDFDKLRVRKIYTSKRLLVRIIHVSLNIFFCSFCLTLLVNVVHHFQVDFKQMEIVRPTRQHIRRTFTPGISLEYTSSPNELTLSTKINSVQVSERKIEGEELWQTRLKSF